jgi:hypothetical protein
MDYLDNPLPASIAGEDQRAAKKVRISTCVGKLGWFLVGTYTALLNGNFVMVGRPLVLRVPLQKSRATGGASYGEQSMSEAVKLIVDAYVSLKDRVALEEMREHRQRLRRDLGAKAGGWVDVSRSIQLFDEDIEAVEAGLARL